MMIINIYIALFFEVTQSKMPITLLLETYTQNNKVISVDSLRISSESEVRHADLFTALNGTTYLYVAYASPCARLLLADDFLLFKFARSVSLMAALLSAGVSIVWISSSTAILVL